MVQAAADRDRAAAATDRVTREAAATAGMTRPSATPASGPTRPGSCTIIPTACSGRPPRRLRRSAGPTTSPPAVRRPNRRLAELAATRRAVDELARHTRLIAAYANSRQKFAAKPLGPPTDFRYDHEYMTELCERIGEAFRRFGLDPINGPAEEVARAVAASRLRDALLGMLLEWHHDCRGSTAGDPDSPAAEPVVKDRLGQVVRSVRRLCGGAYARWQDLLDRKDDAGLVAFAASPDALSFRSRLVAALGRDLQWRGQYPGHARLPAGRRRSLPRRRLAALRPLLICYAARPPDYAEALQHVSAASVLQPDNAAFYLYLGRCHARLGSHDQAVAAFRKAIALDPNSVKPREDLNDSLSQITGLGPLHEWLDGKWERVTATEGAPVREAVRAVLECKGVLDKAVTTYYGRDRILRSHAANIKTERSGSVAALTCRVVKVLEGPGKDQEVKPAETHIYRLDEDTFCEVGGLSGVGGDGRPQPYIATWKRVRDK